MLHLQHITQRFSNTTELHHPTQDVHWPSLLGWCRLTKQVSAFYSEVLRLLNSPPLNQHFDKSWTAHVQVKETLYDVESQLQQAAQLHKDDDIAPEIARLKVIISAVA